MCLIQEEKLLPLQEVDSYSHQNPSQEFMVISLIINLVLITGIMSLLGASLTLPGMAGIVLTVGMAVDANVLIFSRIREELKEKDPQTAIRDGFSRAFVTIFDANVTTLIAALILYIIGTGPVKGFAITLSIGICILYTSEAADE